MDFENLSAKYKFLVIPISGTNTGTMIFDSLQRTDVYESIAVTDVYEFSYAAHISDSFHVLPFASSNDFMETLIKLVKDEEIEVIIPGSDWELKRIAHDRILFESLGVFLLINSDQVLDTCFDKKIWSKV